MTNCGIDIIEISRIEKALKSNPSFLTKVFSEEEISYFHSHGSRTESLAGFFAAKEAFSKYLGTGISGFSFSDISVSHTPEGKPYLKFKGNMINASLSISHNKTTAVAVVCGNGFTTLKAQSQNEVLPPSLMLEMKSLVPSRPTRSHKGDFGRLLIIAGSRGMTGAAVLSAYSALRTGAGIVTLATAHTERAVAASFYPEIITEALESEDGIISSSAIDKILCLAQGKDAIVFGPGLGKSAHILTILQSLLTSYSGTLVIDADGLNALSQNIEILKNRTCKLILTPHPGEMARLTDKPTSFIQKNRLEVAREFSQKHKLCLVLKGNETIVAREDGTFFLNPTGGPGMATAGTGDVLAGTIAALSGQGLSPFDAAKLGVFLHGLAGDEAAARLGGHGIIATDVANELPTSINKILNFI